MFVNNCLSYEIFPLYFMKGIQNIFQNNIYYDCIAPGGLGIAVVPNPVLVRAAVSAPVTVPAPATVLAATAVHASDAVPAPAPAHVPVTRRRAARAPAPAPPPVVRGRARGRGRDGGGNRLRVVDAVPDPQHVPYKTYRNPDVSNQLPDFKPSCPVGMHFGQGLLRNSMTKAVDFFNLFFYSRDDKQYLQTY